MTVLVAAVNATLPAFVLIAVGALAKMFFPKLDVGTLSKLAIYVLLPPLIFNAMRSMTLTFGDALRLAVAYILYLLILGGLCFLATRDLKGASANAVVATVLFGNTGNMGLPITEAAYGIEGLERAIVIFLISIFGMFVGGPALLSGITGNLFKRLQAALRLPPIWACVLGVLWNVQRWQIPNFAETSLQLLGDATIPIMLLALGMQLRTSWTFTFGRTVLRSSLLRLVIGPFVAYDVALWCQLPTLDRNVLILSAVMPAAVTVFVMAVEVGGDAVGVARTVVWHTALSLFAIILVLYYLPGG